MTTVKPPIFCSFCRKGSFESALETPSVPACTLRFQTERFTVWRCCACQSIHALEQVDLAPYYEAFPLHHQQTGIHLKAVFKNRLQTLKTLGFDRDKSLLDFGCGSGLFLRFLREQGYSEVAGYEPYSRDFSSPRSLMTGHYDFVASQDVIEHSDRPEEEVRIVRRILKPKGIYVVGTPRAEGISLQRPQDLLVHIGQPYHRHIFSERALSQFISANGFDEIKREFRPCFDSFLPGGSEKFVIEYLRHFGGVLDTAAAPPRIFETLTSPRLLFFLFFGKFFKHEASMTKCFRNSGRNVAFRIDPPSPRL